MLLQNQISKQATLFLPGLILAVIGTSYATYALLSPDAAYFLDVSARLLDGKKLYSDFVDNQFPTIHLISMVVVWLSKILNFHVVDMFFLFSFLLLNASIFLSWFFLKENSLFQKRSTQILIITLLYYSFFILPCMVEDWWNSFGQREHLFCVLILPYIVLALNHIQRIELQPLPETPFFQKGGAVILAGLLAGIGFSIKPHFFLVFAASELFMMYRSKNVLAWLRIESVMILIMLTTCILGMFFLVPEYFQTLPYFADLLQGIAMPWRKMLLICFFLSLIPIVLLMGYWVRKKSRLAWSFVPYLFILSIASIFTFVLSIHAAAYHSLPYCLFTLLLVGLMLFVGSQKISKAFFLVFLTVLMIQYGIQHHSMVQEKRDFTLKVAQKIRQYAPNGTVAPLDVVLAFPSITYAAARRGLNTAYLWYVPFAYQKYRDKTTVTPYHTPSQMGKTEHFFHEGVIHNLETDPPQLIMINSAPRKWWRGDMQFDFIDYFSLDPRFKKIWKNYRLVSHQIDPVFGFQFEFYQMSEENKNHE